MPTSGRLRLIYFIAVGTFAAWVGFWGYFIPAEVGKALPWPVPPLHSRFIGAMYLSGMVLMFGSAFWPRLTHMRTALWMASIWTWRFAIGFGLFYLLLAVGGMGSHHQFGLGLQPFDHPFHAVLGGAGIVCALIDLAFGRASATKGT